MNAFSQLQYKPNTVLVMVCIYIFLFIERPWESIRFLQNVPIEKTYAVVMIFVAFVCHRFRLSYSPTNIWVYGLLVLHFILAPFAFNSGFALDQGIEYSKMIILYLLMLSVVDDEKSLEIIVKAYVISMFIYMSHSLLEYNNGRYVYRMGISRMVGVDSTYNDPNSFGASVVLSLPFAYILLVTEAKSKIKKLYLLYFAIAITCIVLTGSRSSFIALLFLVILFTLTQKVKIKIFTVLIPLLLVVWNVMPVDKQNRIRTIWDPEAGPANAQESAEGRLEGFKVSWEMFKQRPLTGVGAGGQNFIGYRITRGIDELAGTTQSPTQSHVLYGQVLAAFGICGAFCMTGLVASIIISCMRAKVVFTLCGTNDSFLGALGRAILISLLLLLILGFGGHNFYRPLWLWLAAWSGSLLMIAEQARCSVDEQISVAN